MKIINPITIASTKISVTNTATLLFTLMDTAGSMSGNAPYYSTAGANVLIITAEDGDVRLGINNLTPTSALGELISQGQKVILPIEQLDKVKLIRTGSSNVACSVLLASATEDESVHGLSLSGAAITSVTPGTGATNLGKAEDAQHTTGDTGVFSLSVANEAQSTLAADGDYIARAADTKGNTIAVGNIAHDTGDAGNPIKIGGKALTAQPTAVTANDRVNAMFDVYGRQVVVGTLREMKGAQITTITASTAETTVITADATYKLDVYAVICTNTSATATEVSFKDSTGGTTRFTISVPANDQRGFALTPDAGHNQNAANNNWTATCADSVSSIIITVLFVKNL